MKTRTCVPSSLGPIAPHSFEVSPHCCTQNRPGSAIRRTRPDSRACKRFPLTCYRPSPDQSSLSGVKKSFLRSVVTHLLHRTLRRRKCRKSSEKITLRILLSQFLWVLAASWPRPGRVLFSTHAGHLIGPYIPRSRGCILPHLPRPPVVPPPSGPEDAGRFSDGKATPWQRLEDNEPEALMSPTSQGPAPAKARAAHPGPICSKKKSQTLILGIPDADRQSGTKTGPEQFSRDRLAGHARAGLEWRTRK
jgi:hypothetical protein